MRSIVLVLLTGASLILAQDAPERTLPPESYHVLHAHTKYWQQEGTTHKWIGVNTEMLTDLPVETTVNNRPVTSTVPVHVVASTVTSAEKGYATGDVVFAISPKWLEAIKKVAAEVEAEVPCAGKKRQVCGLSAERMTAFVKKIEAGMKPGGQLEWLNNVPLPRISVKAPDIAKFVVGIANKRVLTVATISIASYRAAQAAKNVNWNPVFKVSSKMTSPVSEGGGEGADEATCPQNLPSCEDCKGVEGYCTTQTPTCPCTQECPADKPKCEDQNCKGDKNDECTVKNRGCKCTRDCEKDPEAVPICKECGGNDGKDKCKGIENENGKWRSCSCYEWKDTQLTPYRQYPIKNREFPKRLPKYEPPKAEPKGPGKGKEKDLPANHNCNPVPDGTGKWMTRAAAKHSINRFCSGDLRHTDLYPRLGERLVGQNDDQPGMSNVLEQGYPAPEDSGATTIWIFAFKDAHPNCKNKIAQVVEEDCVSALEYVVDKCNDNGNDLKKFGGGANINCQYYKITPIARTPLGILEAQSISDLPGGL